MMELGGKRYMVGLREVKRQHDQCLCKHVIVLVSHDLVIMHCVQVASLIHHFFSICGNLAQGE